jgi:hypothetical protein
MAAPTLADLLPPVTADEVKALLLSTLAGIGPVEQIGPGSGAVIVSGSPANNYDGVLIITTSGALGAGAFKLSFDDGVTFTGPFTIPASGVYSVGGSGLTLTFSGVFTLATQYLFKTIFPPFPVTNWLSGGGGRTFTEAEAEIIANFSGVAIGEIAGGGFVDYASGDGAPADWLSLLSSQLYQNDRFLVAPASGLVLLTLAATAPPLTINPGDLRIANSIGTGNLVYDNSSSFSLGAGTSLAVPVVAEAPGSLYNVQNGVLTVLLTPKPGLTVNNPAPGSSAVTPSGGATGTVAVAGTPNGNYNVVLKCTTSGALGVAQIQASLDGGADFSAPFLIPGSGVVALSPTISGVTVTTGLTLTCTGAFTSGDSYTFTSYATWLLVAGQDQESNLALQSRDKAKWTTLGVGGAVATTYDYLARITPNGGSEVVKTFSQPDPVVGGQVDIVVAGAAGPVSATALSNISAYISARVPLGSKASVQNASVTTITVTATVYVLAAQAAAADAAIKAAFSKLALATPIGGTVYLADIITAIEDQKPSGVSHVVVPIGAPLTDTVLAAANVAAFTLNLTYILI